MGRFVEWLSFSIACGQFCCAFEDWSSRCIGRSVLLFASSDQYIERRFQIHEQRFWIGGELLTIGIGFERPAAESENNFRSIERCGQGLMFNFAKVSFAGALENFGDAGLLRANYFLIEIDECPTEFLRETQADCALAGTHESGEDDALWLAAVGWIRRGDGGSASGNLCWIL
jgi:hypothetical protein